MRKCAYNYYQENRFYKFEISNKISICNIEDRFDTESKLVFAYLRKHLIVNRVYILKNICEYNFNILVCAYENEHDVHTILTSYRDRRDEYIKKNIMSCILFVCKYANRYFIFSTFIRNNCIRFDKNNDTHLAFVKYYYSSDVDYNRIFFTNDIIKYVKLGDKFKLTKYSPFLINL